jgi:geranylgeranyl pyrophosphate synthase
VAADMPNDLSDLRADVSRAFEYACDAARGAMPTPQMAAVLETALAGFKQHGGDRYRGPVQVPLAVYAAVRGETSPAVPLAAAVGLFCIGLDIGDHLTDDELDADWKRHSLADIQIMMVALLASLPQQIIDRLDAPAAIRARMLGMIARSFLEMMGGQQQDVQTVGRSDVRAAAVTASIAAKAGEGGALFASLAARFAGADDERAEHYAAMGRAFTTATQLVSDCDDIFAAPHSRDLAAGTRTLPIAVTLERLAGPARDEFAALLDRARTEADAGVKVRARIVEAGVLPLCAFRIEVYRQRALAALAAADAREPGGAWLRAMISRCEWPRPPAVSGFLPA